MRGASPCLGDWSGRGATFWSVGVTGSTMGGGSIGPSCRDWGGVVRGIHQTPCPGLPSTTTKYQKVGQSVCSHILGLQYNIFEYLIKLYSRYSTPKIYT